MTDEGIGQQGLGAQGGGSRDFARRGDKFGLPGGRTKKTAREGVGRGKSKFFQKNQEKLIKHTYDQ